MDDLSITGEKMSDIYVKGWESSSFPPSPAPLSHPPLPSGVAPYWEGEVFGVGKGRTSKEGGSYGRGLWLLGVTPPLDFVFYINLWV